MNHKEHKSVLELKRKGEMNMENTMKMYITADEVAELLGVSRGYAYKVIRGLNDELKAKQIKENLENSKEKLSAEDDYTETINEIEQNIEDIKNHLVDDNMVVKKGTDGITVKLYSED